MPLRKQLFQTEQPLTRPKNKGKRLMNSIQNALHVSNQNDNNRRLHKKRKALKHKQRNRKVSKGNCTRGNCNQGNTKRNHNKQFNRNRNNNVNRNNSNSNNSNRNNNNRNNNVNRNKFQSHNNRNRFRHPENNRPGRQNIFRGRGMNSQVDSRFDRKYLQEDIIIDSIQKEIQNIVPQILTNISKVITEH